MESQVSIHVTKRQVVMVNTGSAMVEMNVPNKMALSIVTLGKQGPVGAVAEDVLNMAKAAETMAKAANKTAQGVAHEQQLMVTGMTTTLDHYIGAISAQE